MCALQDCGNTPLLGSRDGEVVTSQFLVGQPSNSPDLVMAGFIASRRKSSRAEEDQLNGNKLSSEILNSSDFMNIPSNYEEKQHFKSKKIFPTTTDMYSGYDRAPAEVDQLLPTKAEKIHFMKEAENLIDQGSKQPFTQRSVSDYYLSKRYEEVKFVPSAEVASSVRPEFTCGMSPGTESHDSFAAEGRNSEFCTPTNSSCFIPPSDVLFSDAEPVALERRTSFQIDCEPGTSGLALETPDGATGFDERNIYKACNLNPTVNMKIFDTESLSESGDIGASSSTNAEASVQRVSDDAWFMPSSRHTFSGAELSGSASAAQLSIASSFGDSNTPTCKICHMPAKTDDPLISPCRCTGTLHYIHCGCLMRWLEICNKRSRKPPACELCKYQFHWHKKFKVRHWQFPHCSWRDKILHTVFLISVLVMIGCAIVTVMCFRQHRGNKADIAHLELSQSEIITLICGALFFLAFFLAMYVEIKARNTIYKLLVKFIYLNQQWYIDEYDKKGENTVIDV